MSSTATLDVAMVDRAGHVIDLVRMAVELRAHASTAVDHMIDECERRASATGDDRYTALVSELERLHRLHESDDAYAELVEVAEPSIMASAKMFAERELHGDLNESLGAAIRALRVFADRADATLAQKASSDV